VLALRGAAVRFALVLLGFSLVVGCSNTNASDGDGSVADGGCGPMPMTGFPMCNTCVLCGPPMDSMGRRGCTDGTTHGCLDCRPAGWVMETISGCFDDTGVAPDAARVDAFVPVDTGAADAAVGDASNDAAADVGGATDATTDAGAVDAGSDAS
jgi:hypothetical protein